MNQKLVPGVALITAVLLMSPAGSVSADQNYYPAEGQVKISALNPSENWVKMSNIGHTAVDLAGWALYDENDRHELFLTESDIIRGDAGRGLILAPGSEVAITGKNDEDFRLYNAGGEVRLFSGPMEISGALQDKIFYPAIAEGETYEILPENSSENGNENSISDSPEIADNAHKTYQEPENSNSNLVLETPITKPEKSAGGNDKKSAEKASEALGKANAGTTSQEQPDNQESLDPNSNQDTPTFMASSQREKSPWGWYYWLSNSWFLRRIIIPLIGLWLALYIVIYFLRKKLTKNE